MNSPENTQSFPPTPDQVAPAAAGHFMDQDSRHHLMRGISGTAGYEVVGVSAMQMPGLAPKVAGAALIAKGMHEQWVGMGGAAKEGSTGERIRDRVLGFAESLVDNNTGKMNLSARLKRGIGENLLGLKDKEYRMRFNRMMGGMMIAGAGLQVMDQPGIIAKAVGLATATAGVTEFTWNQQKGIDRYKELTPETSQTAVQA